MSSRIRYTDPLYKRAILCDTVQHPAAFIIFYEATSMPPSKATAYSVPSNSRPIGMARSALIALLLVTLPASTHAAGTLQAAPPSRGIVLYVSNLRAGPGTTYAAEGTAQPSQVVQVFDCSDACDWYQVDDGGPIDLSGWRLKDDGNVFEVPAFDMAAGQRCRSLYQRDTSGALRLQLRVQPSHLG